MKPSCRVSSLYGGLIACLMVLTACSGGGAGGGQVGSNSGGENAAPATATPEGFPPEIGIGAMDGTQAPGAVPQAAGTGQLENSPSGTSPDTTGSGDQPPPEAIKIKNQDGVLIKGTWKKQSSLQPTRKSLISMIGEFFIGTAYAENFGTSVSFQDIVQGQSGGGDLSILLSVPQTDQLKVVNAKAGKPISDWKGTFLNLKGYGYTDYQTPRLLTAPNVSDQYITWMGNGGMEPLHLARLVADNYGNISQTDLPTLSSYISSTASDYSLLDDATIRQTPSGDIAAVAVSLNNLSYESSKLAAGAYKCEPTVIGVYREQSNTWETKQIPCHAGMENKTYSAKYTSVGFDANSNLIVFQTSNTSPTSYYLTGYKFPYDKVTGTFGSISTISDTEVKDSPDGLMKFVADDAGGGYVLGLFKSILLTGNVIDVQVPADCTEEGASKAYFYFMDTCFKTKAIQQKGNQLVVYRYNSKDNTLTPIDAIPLLGWMGNWDKHNFSATFDHGSKKMVVGVNQEDTTYPSILARYGENNGENTKEYLDTAGLPLGSSNFYLTSFNDAISVGMWAMAQIQKTCSASGSCTSGSYATGSTIYKFSPDIPVAETYGSPTCTNNMPVCSGGNTTGNLSCDSYGQPECGGGILLNSGYQPVCDSYSVMCKPYSSPPIPVEPYNPCANSNTDIGTESCCVGTTPTCKTGLKPTCDTAGNVSCTQYFFSLATCPVPDGPVKCW